MAAESSTRDENEWNSNNDTANIAPNCNKKRYQLKTLGAYTCTENGSCTENGACTENGRVCFQSVSDYKKFISVFRKRLLKDDEVKDAPNGRYCWILRKKNDKFRIYAMKVITKQEIGSLHNFIYILSSNPGPLLGEDDKFKDAKEVIAAGELHVKGENRLFNLQSGSFMEPIFGIKSCQPIPGRLIHKTRAMLMEERKEKKEKRDTLVAQVAPLLDATFASVDLPEPDNPLEKAAVTKYAKSVSDALGGMPFIQDAHIITSKSNMVLLRSFMSTEPQVWKANRPPEQSKKRKGHEPAPNPPIPKLSNSSAKRAKQSHPKRGGAHRTRKRLHKKQTCRR